MRNIDCVADNSDSSFVKSDFKPCLYAAATILPILSAAPANLVPLSSAKNSSHNSCVTAGICNSHTPGLFKKLGSFAEVRPDSPHQNLGCRAGNVCKRRFYLF